MAQALTPSAATAGGNASASTSASSGDAQVHEAGTFRPGVMRWGYFLLLNAISGAIAAAFFVGVFYAEGLDPYMAGTYAWLLAHPSVTSLMAFSPLLCSLLVGYGYAQRARKRKKAAAQRAELLEQVRAKRKAAAAEASA